MGEALVIDGFLDDFEQFRESLDTHIFSGVKSPADGVFYPGVSINVPESVRKDIYSKLKSIFKSGVTINYCFMRISQIGIYAPHRAHNDVSMGQMSCMIYLNRENDCQGGTSFISHVEGIMVDGPKDESEFKTWQRDCHDDSKWIVDSMCEMKSNRACIFPAKDMHRSEPAGGFGSTTKDARLVLVVFFNVDS